MEGWSSVACGSQQDCWGWYSARFRRYPLGLHCHLCRHLCHRRAATLTAGTLRLKHLNAVGRQHQSGSSVNVHSFGPHSDCAHVFFARLQL
jgi:hypothetical protein